MAATDPAGPRGRARLVAALVALAVLAVLGLVGALVLSGGEDAAVPPSEPSGAPSPTGTPLAQVETTATALQRDSFCAAVGADAVARALGGADAETAELTRWDNGERARLEPGLRDVAHEYGCSWAGPRGRRAEAWVFAPPLTRGEARTMAAGWSRQRGCSPVPDAAALGRPTTTVDCRAGGRRERVVAGLVGEAWLTCRVGDRVEEATRAEIAERASTWCSAALAAASAR